MGLFRKIGRGIKSAVKSRVGRAVRGALVTAIPGARQVSKAASMLRSIGAPSRTGRRSTALEMANAKLDAMGPLVVRSMPATRDALPGGAPLARRPRRSRKRTPPSASAAVATTRKRRKRSSSSSTTRKPPTAKQLAAREKFKAMVKARAAARRGK